MRLSQKLSEARAQHLGTDACASGNRPEFGQDFDEETGNRR
jgi:hypothetical protein